MPTACGILRPIAVLVACVTGSIVPAHAQSVCSNSELAFVGRAEPPVTFRVSGEAEIEKARQNLIRTEEDVARLKASLDERSQLEHAREFAIRLIEANRELSMRRAMYPKPYDITFIPLAVVRAFRGVPEATLMLLVRPNLPPIQPGEEYLIFGARSKQLIPPFAEMGDITSLADYVEARHVVPAASAQQGLQFLASTASGATVMGTLRMHSFGDGVPPALGGVSVLVSSGGQVVETTTREDGGFVASGLRAGTLEIKPALASELTIVPETAQTVSVPEGGCAHVELRAAINGRVRGRIVSATGAALDTVHLRLSFVRADRRMWGSHDPHFETRARADGSFEFSGVSAGDYLLSASVEKMEDGKTRRVATYYPGTDDLDAATPLTVGKATLHDGFDFVVRME